MGLPASNLLVAPSVLILSGSLRALAAIGDTRVSVTEAATGVGAPVHAAGGDRVVACTGGMELPPLRGWRPHPLDALLLAALLALAADLLRWGLAALFFLSSLAIKPLARYIGLGAEELAGWLGSAVVGAVALVNLNINDGESTWLEGAQLFAAYAVLAVAFLVHP